MLAVGRHTGNHSSTLGGGGAAAEDVSPASLPAETSANAVTRSQAKKVLAAPRRAVLPLADWAERTLIDPAGTPSDHPRTVVSANYAPKVTVSPADRAAVYEFVQQRQVITRFVQDALQAAVDKQKENADKHGRNNKTSFRTGDRALLSTEGIRSSAVTNLDANKLAPRFIGPFKIVKVLGDAYTLDIPTSLRLHPRFYVGRLKRYRPAEIPTSDHQESLLEHTLGAPSDAPVAPSIRLSQGPTPGAANQSVPPQ
ncbi:polyprotein [Phytophthora megakarya]|uniref:Polyprotein n=1 Tax=Phytophthora megakarya TaxID=4795 RepID=A0A225WY90_9STRA|nr:polyprotein [Phytophthora megakarya]